MKIRWTRKAINSYKKILSSTIETFGITTANLFVQRTNNALDIIKKNPLAYETHDDDKDFRRAIIVKSISLFYTVKSNEIIIVTLWDNRRNPENLKL